MNGVHPKRIYGTTHCQYAYAGRAISFEPLIIGGVLSAGFSNEGGKKSVVERDMSASWPPTIPTMVNSAAMTLIRMKY